MDAYARNQSGGGPVLYVNRSAPIAGAAAVAGAPAMIESPTLPGPPVRRVRVTDRRHTLTSVS